MKLDVNGWWQSFSSSLLAGADGLGVYLDDRALTLAHVEKGLKGLQVQHIIRLDREGTEDLAPRLKEAVSRWGLEGCPVSLAVSRDLGFLRPAVLPRAAAENLAQVVSYELDRFFPRWGCRASAGFPRSSPCSSAPSGPIHSRRS